MKGDLYLIGGGEVRNGETAEIDDELKKRAPKDASFVFFASAAGDNPDYINTMRSVFSDRFNFVAPAKKDGPQFARSAIESASIIYLSGGTTELLLNRFHQWGLVESLHTALERGSHLVGMSAGAQALANTYIHEEGGGMELRQGWGFLPVCVLVHANEHSFQAAIKLWKECSGSAQGKLLGIGDGSAWRVNKAGSSQIGSGDIWQV